MSNYAKVTSKTKERALPGMLLSDINSVQWATGFTGSNGIVLTNGSDGVFITDSRYTIQAQQQVKDVPVISFAATESTMADMIAKEARRMGLTEIGFESQSVTVATQMDWDEKLGGIELLPTKDFVAPLRAVKTPEEVAIIRRACALADKTLEHVMRLIQPGVSEYEINLEIEFFIRRNGAGIAFEPIVVSGERSAFPHGRASDKKLAVGDFVTIDMGANVDGYNSDITRTFVVGEASERHREVYGAVLKAQLAALDAMKPGVSGKAVDQASRDALAEFGLDKYFGHGLGHGLGRLVHDSGSMSPRSETILEPGMVLTVEPGVYIEGFGGVRIEDDVVVTEAGIDILTHFPKELLVLPKA